MGCKRVRFGGQKESFWKAKGVVLEIERKKPHTKNHKALPPAPPPQGGEWYDLRAQEHKALPQTTQSPTPDPSPVGRGVV